MKKKELLKKKNFSMPQSKEQKKADLGFDYFKKAKIRVIGIGGGGSNIVSEIAAKVKKISFVAANTDLQALKSLRRNIVRFHFGEKFTHGLGTGMDFELAKEAALSEKEKIKKLFSGQDLCILISTLGGGAGSGTVPVFANIAKSLGVLTLGVFTLPFKFEGEKKQEIANQSLSKLKHVLNAVIVLPNDRIFQLINKDTPLKDALSAINKNLAESLEGLIDTVFLPGLINIDFADLKTILQSEGKFAYLNSAEFETKEKMLGGIKNILNCPLYFYTIRSAKRVLFNIVGERELSLEDVSFISKTIFEQVHPEAKIIFGISQKVGQKDKIRVTILATGCMVKNFFENNLKKEKELKDKTKKVVSPKKEEEKKPPIKKSKKKFKIKVQKKEDIFSSNNPANEEEKKDFQPVSLAWAEKENFKIRKNGLQVKKDLEEIEKEFLEKEKFWETPAFLRKQEKA